MPMLIKSVKNKDYGLLVDHVKINMEQGYIVSRLKNANYENFYFNGDDKMWYFKNYKKDIRLIDILYPDKNILEVEFKNNDHNDYLPDNLIIKLNPRFENSFMEPSNYQILEEGTSVLIKEGSCAGEYRNMYWKVKDSEDSTYYLMHIKDELYTKISKRDINKVLTFSGSDENKKDFRPTWRLFQNGYVCCTINNGLKPKVYYLHQLIMDVHDEDMTNFEKTVDHINQDKLDNRRQNLRLVNMSVQNANRSKPERRKDACELPDGIEQKDLPKYVVYRKEFLDKEKNKFREYFYICNHPKLEKSWDTTKSNEISIKEKLRLVKLKLQELEGTITEKQYQKETGQDKQIDMPPYIRLTNTRNKLHLVFDKRDNGGRLGYTMVLKSTDVQKELDNFIDLVNKKYPELAMGKYQIKNIGKIKEKDISNEENKKSNTEVKLTLPANFSFFRETNGGYQFGFSKSIDGERLCAKSKVQSDDIQKEFNKFVDIVNKKFPQLKINQYQIPNIPDDFIHFVKITKSNEQVKTDSSDTDNTNIAKPVMPTNFSITTINSIDYIQFCKKIEDKKFQYKTKINSYDIKSELVRFIQELNEKYDLELDPTDYPIVNTNNWSAFRQSLKPCFAKTTNKIVDHSDSAEKQLQRERARLYLEKKKHDLGVDEFRKQNAEKAKAYRQTRKEIEV